MKRLPLAANFAMFILLCISVAYWGMQMFRPPLRAVAAQPQMARADAPVAAAIGLFGGQTGTQAVASNYQLKGVVVAGNENESIAIVGAEGKPVQSVRVGAELQPGVSVREVHAQYIVLSENGVSKRVELPDSLKGARVDFGSVSPVPVNAPPPAPPPPPPPPSPATATEIVPGYPLQSPPAMGMPVPAAQPSNQVTAPPQPAN